MLFKSRESKTHKWMDKEPHDKLLLKDLWLIKGNCPLIQSITQPANFYQEFWTKRRKVSFLESMSPEMTWNSYYYTQHLLPELKED